VTETDKTVAAAEQAVLGAAMISKLAAEQISRVCDPADFGDLRHDVIAGAIYRLRAVGAPTDTIAVVDELLRAGELQSAGGAEYVHALTSAVPSASSAEYYAAIVKEASVGRTLVQALIRAQDSIVRGEQAGTVLARALGDLAALRDHGRSRHIPLRSLGEIFDVPNSEDVYDWTIPGLLERRDRLILTGSEGGGKSELIRQLAICAAAGIHPFTQQHTDARRVLVIDAENTERQWRRKARGLAANAAQRGTADPRRNLAPQFVRDFDVTRSSDLGDVHDWIDQWKPDIVTIGPLYRICASINNDEEAKPVLAALESIRDRDVTLIIEGHAGHADSRTQTRELRPIGSSALLRWPEFGLGLAKPEKIGDPHRIIRWRGDRDERPWPATLTDSRVNPQTFPWEPTPGYWATPEGRNQLI
jgi:hypothetical protein